MSTHTFHFISHHALVVDPLYHTQSVSSVAHTCEPRHHRDEWNQISTWIPLSVSVSQKGTSQMSERVSNYKHTYSVFFFFFFTITEPRENSCAVWWLLRKHFVLKKILLTWLPFVFSWHRKKKNRKNTQQKVPACLFKSQACLATFSPPTQKKKRICVYL